MTADDVIAHSKALHATFGEMNAAVESIIAEGRIAECWAEVDFASLEKQLRG
jgi:hypothetical protein